MTRHRIFGTSFASIYPLRIRIVRADGERRWVAVSAVRIGVAGSANRAVLHVEDITGRKGYETRLLHLANTDPLTGLANHRRFREDLERFLTLIGSVSKTLIDSLRALRHRHATRHEGSKGCRRKDLNQGIGLEAGGTGWRPWAGRSRRNVLISDFETDPAPSSPHGGTSLRNVPAGTSVGAARRHGWSSSSQCPRCVGSWLSDQGSVWRASAALHVRARVRMSSTTSVLASA